MNQQDLRDALETAWHERDEARLVARLILTLCLSGGSSVDAETRMALMQAKAHLKDWG